MPDFGGPLRIMKSAGAPYFRPQADNGGHRWTVTGWTSKASGRGFDSLRPPDLSRLSSHALPPGCPVYQLSTAREQRRFQAIGCSFLGRRGRRCPSVPVMVMVERL